jgi:hypothetical protein
MTTDWRKGDNITKGLNKGVQDADIRLFFFVDTKFVHAVKIHDLL